MFDRDIPAPNVQEAQSNAGPERIEGIITIISSSCYRPIVHAFILHPVFARYFLGLTPGLNPEPNTLCNLGLLCLYISF